MKTNNQRIEEFKEEIGRLDVRPPEDNRERAWLIAGVLLTVAGLVVVLIGYWGASGTSSVAEQIPYLISGGVLGLGLTIVGCALFVRYSLTRYLRFWLLRSIYEDRTQTDRTVEALGRIEEQLRVARRSSTESGAVSS
jgi:hypothetical protein